MQSNKVLFAFDPFPVVGCHLTFVTGHAREEGMAMEGRASDDAASSGKLALTLSSQEPLSDGTSNFKCLDSRKIWEVDALLLRGTGEKTGYSHRPDSC